MSVVAIQELNPSGSVAFDQQLRYWRREYRRTFRVITDDAHDGPVTVAASLPASLGDYYNVSATEQDKYSFMMSYTVEPDTSADDLRQWTATIHYGPWNPAEWPEAPQDQPPEIRGGFVQLEKVCDVDVNGKPITNSAGDPFDPPAMRDDSRPVLSVTINTLAFDPGYIDSYRDTLNQGVFFGADPGTVKVMSISYERLFNPFVGWFWRVSYEFQFDGKGWKKTILNAGLYQLDSSSKPVPILLSGVPAQEPQLLDGNGKVVNLQAGGTANYLTFEVYESKDFSVFGLSRAEAIMAGTGT